MTASLNGMTLPSWGSHLLHKLAPPPLLLVQAFVDTLDLDLHTGDCALTLNLKPTPGEL